MADYDISPTLGFQLPIKGNGVLFDQNVVRNNFSKADDAVKADRARLTALEGTGVPQAGSDGDRDQKIPNPIHGNRVYRTDKLYTEMYYGVWNATSNPYGARVAGWYPHNVQPELTAWQNGWQVANSGASQPFLRGGNNVSWTTAQGYPVPKFNMDVNYLKVPFLGLYDVIWEVAVTTSTSNGQRNLNIDTAGNMNYLGINSADIPGTVAATTPALIHANVRFQCTQVDLSSGNGNGGIRPGYTQNSGIQVSADARLTVRWVGPDIPIQVAP